MNDLITTLKHNKLKEMFHCVKETGGVIPSPSYADFQETLTTGLLVYLCCTELILHIHKTSDVKCWQNSPG